VGLRYFVPLYVGHVEGYGEKVAHALFGLRGLCSAVLSIFCAKVGVMRDGGLKMVNAGWGYGL